MLALPTKTAVTFENNEIPSNRMRDSQHVWQIGLSSWIIQDGNYGDLETGQVLEFALEFYSENFRPSGTKRKSFKKIDAAKYEIVGEVIFLSDAVWVLDFGVRAFRESKPPNGISVGSFVTAEIHLGIDPFFYFEYLYDLQGMPPLIFTWIINSIDQQTAPFIESREAPGRKLLIRDQKKLGYKTIPKTDAWKDDGGHAEYILTCELLQTPPKHTT